MTPAPKIKTVTSPSTPRRCISIVVPLHNEEKNIPLMYEALIAALAPLPYRYELLLVNDGSADRSAEVCRALERAHPGTVRFIDFSRNFGKEAATTAGFHEAVGDAVLAIDADLQHPPKHIPELVAAWEQGAEVVIGVRTNNASDSWHKKVGSRLYYTVINRLSGTDILPGATDFRLLDRIVVDEFKRLTERNRMTRALIDWLGFRRAYVHFEAPERIHGEATYSFWKLVKLAVESMIAHSLFPLRIAGYIGGFIILCSTALGSIMITDRYIVHMGLNFSGPAILANILLFMSGLVLISLGLLAYYIGHIHTETQNRPLYVIRRTKKDEGS
jgi:polyisoprenyl-phosphate glycosyltransferase